MRSRVRIAFDLITRPSLLDSLTSGLCLQLNCPGPSSRLGLYYTILCHITPCYTIFCHTIPYCCFGGGGLLAVRGFQGCRVQKFRRACSVCPRRTVLAWVPGPPKCLKLWPPYPTYTLFFGIFDNYLITLELQVGPKQAGHPCSNILVYTHTCVYTCM